MTSEPILMQFDCKSSESPMSTLSPFGNIDYSKGSSDNNYQFTGKEIDQQQKGLFWNKSSHLRNHTIP